MSDSQDSKPILVTYAEKVEEPSAPLVRLLADLLADDFEPHDYTMRLLLDEV